MKPIEYFLAIRFIQSRRDVFFSLTSILSVLSVALSITVLIVILSITSGFQIELKQRLIGAGSHIQVEKIGGITDWVNDLDRVLAQPSVKNVSPYITNQGFVDINGNLQFVSFTGIDYKRDSSTTKLSELLVTGNFSLAANEILIGSELSERFNISVGDVVTLFLPQFKSRHEVKIVGVFKTGIFYMDIASIYLDLDSASTFFKTNDRISGFRISITDGSNVEAVGSQLSDTLGGVYSVSTWMNQNESLVEALKVEQRIMLMVVFTLILISSFTITSSMIIKVISKIRDVGIVSSLGLSPLSISMIFVIQGLIIGLIGTILGFVLGSIASININEISYLLESVLNFELIPDSVYYSSSIPVNLEPQHYILSAGISVSLSLLASLLPAYRASKLSVVEALRHD